MKSSGGQRLFNVGKIGCFVDDYGPGVEKRRGEEVSVLTLSLRIQPFDAKLASALDAGVGGDSNIKATIFSMNSGEPKPAFTRHDFSLGLPRQNLTIFASPDTTEARLVLEQAKITGTYVRTQKDMNALALVLKATFGPVGRAELEYIHAAHRTQRFITFSEAEPILDLESDGDDDDEDLTDADEKARAQLPPPMFETDKSGKPIEAAADKPKRRSKVESINRPLHSHQKGKKGGKRR